MLNSVSPSVNTGAQPAAVSALTTAPASQAVSALFATDQVYFSAQAENMLAAATVLTSFETPSAPSPQSGSPATAEATAVFVSGAASGYVASDVFDGNLSTYALINAPATANDVLDVGAFSSGAGSIVQTHINGGGGNDTYNVESNGFVQMTTGNGNDTVNLSMIEGGVLDFAEVNLGSGNDVANLNNGGSIIGGSGTDTINLSHSAAEGPVAMAIGGSGTTTINGTGSGIFAWGGAGVTTINNVADVWLGKFSTGTTTANLPADQNSTVHVDSGFGAGIINLATSASGTNTTTIDLNLGTDAGISSTLVGSTLTLSLTGTNETLTVNNYQPGAVIFTFDGNLKNGSTTPPGLPQPAASS